MKAKQLLFAALTLAIGAISCEKSLGDVQQPDIKPKTMKIKLRATGEIDVDHQPLTRFTADDRDLYGVQVWHKPVSTGGYEYYAYGLFDNLDNVELEVKENYKYRIEVRMIDDGKDKIYCDSILVDTKYYLGYGKPFRGRNNYNASSRESITQLTNKFTYDSSRYFLWSQAIDLRTQLTDGKEFYNPIGIDLYYGRVNDYIPTEDGAGLSIYLKHMIFGLKIEVGDFLKEGLIRVEYGDEHSDILTPDNRSLTRTFAETVRNAYWYDTEDLLNATIGFNIYFVWTKEDGSIVRWKSQNVTLYRLKQTVVKLDYYEDDVLGDNHFEVHYEDTPLEENYKEYIFGNEQDDYIFN